MDIVNARDDYGATGDGTTDDTAALQAAIDACFGSSSTPNGTSYWLNKELFIPHGKYKITAPLLLTKLQGAKIYGSGRFTTTIENVTDDSAVFRSNGMGYSSISDMQLQCHAGSQCLDLDWDGTAGGAALQANKFTNLMCYGSYEANTVGVRIGQSGFMGSECIFTMYHTQGCGIGTLINNFNCLQHQFYGGQDQACGVGVWCTVGSAPVINGRAFQVQSECDIRTSGGLHNAMNVTGCRSESRNFIHNDGGQYLDVSACMQLYAGTDVGDFVRSRGGFVTIRNCESTGMVRPEYWCRLILENCQTSLELDLSNLWFLPNNTVAANILIRNCKIYNESQMVDDQRRFTTDGQTITMIDLSAPGSSALPPDPSLPPTTVRWAVTDNEGNQMVAFYVPGPCGPIVIGGGSTPAATTFDPSNTNAKLTLSGGNLTITTNADGAYNVSRATSSKSSGKYYAEITYGGGGLGGGNLGCGIINASQTIASNAYLGDTGNNSIGYFGDGAVYRNNGSVGSIGSYIATNVVCMAVDLDNSKIWWRINGGNWNNSGTDDPATNTGGLAISAISTPVYAAAEGDNSGNVWTANFGATAYSQTPPSGFGNW